MALDVPGRRGGRNPNGPRATALALVLAAGALAACGGGGDTTGSTSSPGSSKGSTPTHKATSTTLNTTSDRIAHLGLQADVRKAVTAVLTTSDPDLACHKFVTDHYLEIAYGGREGCVAAQAPGSAAKELRSYNATIDSETASASVIPRGGPYDGERIKVSLVAAGPIYRIDALRSNAPVGP